MVVLLGHHFCQSSALHHLPLTLQKQRSYTKLTLFALHWPLKTPFTQPYPIFICHFPNLFILNINPVWDFRARIMSMEECKNSISIHKCFQNSSFQGAFSRLPYFIIQPTWNVSCALCKDKERFVFIRFGLLLLILTIFTLFIYYIVLLLPQKDLRQDAYTL